VLDSSAGRPVPCAQKWNLAKNAWVLRLLSSRFAGRKTALRMTALKGLLPALGLFQLCR
jgi:hypothetical protein